MSFIQLETLKQENCNIDDCVDVLMIAKYLEKIGDHAENIGEWEIFQVLLLRRKQENILVKISN